jgi:transcriptional regulator with XRE-family HTH domain
MPFGCFKPRMVRTGHPAGINRNHVGMLEREQHAATVDMLEKLANMLDVDPIEFFKRPSHDALIAYAPTRT